MPAGPSISLPLCDHRRTESHRTTIVTPTPSQHNPQCDVLTVVSELCCTKTADITLLLDEARISRDQLITTPDDLASNLTKICGKTIAVAEDTSADVVFRLGDAGKPYVSFNKPAEHANFVHIIMTKIADCLQKGSPDFAFGATCI